MKMNSTGEFLQEEGSCYAEDIATGERIVLYINKEERIVIRSVFEEDAFKIAKLQKMNNREKKWTLRMFSKETAKDKYFMIEDLENFEKDGTRKIVGFFNILEKDNADSEIERGEACVYVKRKENPILAEILRNRVAIALDEFCFALERKIDIAIYRPQK